MNMGKWKIRQVSTPTEAIKDIEGRMPRPIGIIVYGADSNRKRETVNLICKELRRYRHFSNIPDTPDLTHALDYYCIAIVELDYDKSKSHHVRHQLIEDMRTAKADSIVGIYVKAAKAKITDGMSGDTMMLHAIYNRRIDNIEHSDPTSEIFDRLIIVEEEAEV